mmetsp:Transcript_377/g.973  ORF Transcript_377/g.973 Transcript_377/m.973 type:complete len:176 (-) Transcript_377:138-665(-)
MGEAAERQNVVTEDANWRARCRAEHEAALGWREQWGFLSGGVRTRRPGVILCPRRALDPYARSSLPPPPPWQVDDGEDSLTAFSKKVKRISAANKDAKRWKEEAQHHPKPAAPPVDAVDDFIEVFMARNRKAFGRPNPRDVYNRPILTSHSYGWRGREHRGGTLEQFGRLNIRLR